MNAYYEELPTFLHQMETKYKELMHYYSDRNLHTHNELQAYYVFLINFY